MLMGLIEFTGRLGEPRQGCLTYRSANNLNIFLDMPHPLQEPPTQRFSAEHSACLHLANSHPALPFSGAQKVLLAACPGDPLGSGHLPMSTFHGLA